jgi:hypothetical protein
MFPSVRSGERIHHREEEKMRRELLALAGLGLLLAAPGLLALEIAPATPAQAAQAAAPQAPPAPPAEEEKDVRLAEEVTVESAAKVASKLIDAPATMSVV